MVGAASASEVFASAVGVLEGRRSRRPVHRGVRAHRCDAGAHRSTGGPRGEELPPEELAAVERAVAVSAGRSGARRHAWSRLPRSVGAARGTRDLRGAARRGGRSQRRGLVAGISPAAAARRRLPLVPRASSPARSRSRWPRRSGLRGGAGPRRGARGARPRQDGVLQQRQPRVPHSADADPRPRSRTCWPTRPSRSASDHGRRRARPAQRAAPAQAGQHAARLLPPRGRAGRGALRAGRRWPRSPPSSPACSARPSSAPGCGSTWTARRCREPVFVDREMWEKIVLNLLSNAFKFTFDGADRRTAARGRRRGDARAWRHRRRDRARGPAARLFERFHRIHDARGRARYEGSGIGLALVRSSSASTAARSRSAARRAWAAPSR